MQADLWVEIAKGLPAALVALVIGAAAAYIAWRQKQIAEEQRTIAKKKLGLDLFDRRLKVFEATWGAASDALRQPQHAPPSMTNLYPEASFLFGKEVEAYMKQVAEKMSVLAMIDQMTRSNGDMMPPNRIDEHCAAQTWLTEAALSGIRSVFSPYLDFAEWR